jgi:hypothetical protein
MHGSMFCTGLSMNLAFCTSTFIRTTTGSMSLMRLERSTTIHLKVSGGESV